MTVVGAAAGVVGVLTILLVQMAQARPLALQSHTRRRCHCGALARLLGCESVEAKARAGGLAVVGVARAILADQQPALRRQTRE